MEIKSTSTSILTYLATPESKSPGSIAGLKKYGIQRSLLQYHMLNTFHLAEEAKLALSKYYILHWSGPFTYRSVKEGLIYHDGIGYSIVYHNCNAWSVGRSDNVRLSFRQAAKEFKLPAYVLVSTAIGDTHDSF